MLGRTQTLHLELMHEICVFPEHRVSRVGQLQIKFIYLEVQGNMMLSVHRINSYRGVNAHVSAQRPSYIVHVQRLIRTKTTSNLKELTMVVAESGEADYVLVALQQGIVSHTPLRDTAKVSRWDVPNDPHLFVIRLCFLELKFEPVYVLPCIKVFQHQPCI